MSSSKAEDEELLGDGRFDRHASIRRTRRLRKAPEGAEEECSNLEPRKSPEGVEDPDEADHRKSGLKSSPSKHHPNGDVIVGMEVKKEGEVSTVEVTRRMSEERDLKPEDKDARLARWKGRLGPSRADEAETAVMTASGMNAIKARQNRPFSTDLSSYPVVSKSPEPSNATDSTDGWRSRLARQFRSPERTEPEEDPLAVLRAQPVRSRSTTPLKVT